MRAKLKIVFFYFLNTFNDILVYVANCKLNTFNKITDEKRLNN